jgi:hypothetical protein
MENPTRLLRLLEALRKKGDMPENDLFNALQSEYEDLGTKTSWTCC